ncbi:MAG: right-handed parallel beta-helix repeat-containing protein, partial [Kiritimatiellaeota bacterium]|nr:right-handed parallel beta-helix repeat-containing protein [Kiritimatiellota bacterium]
MKHTFTLLAALLLTPLATLHAAEFCVSPAGDDANPGTSAQPLRTIRKASSVMRAGDRCVIRGGIYRETVVPPDGSEHEPVVYRAHPGESVTISGCDKVGGWTLHTGRIFKATWQGTLGAGNQVFVKRRMAFQARWPNNPSGSLLQPPLATAEGGSDKTRIVCSQLPPANLSGANVWIISGTRWEAWISKLTGSSPGSISFDNRGLEAVACRPGANFYVVGSLALLDAENEWAVDGGQLYLWAPAGADPATLDVEVKARYFGIDLSGKKHVEFRGINLFGCSIKTDSGTADIVIDDMTANYVGHWEPFGDDLKPPCQQVVAMNLEGRSLTIRNSTLFGAAGTLVALTGSDSRIVNCLIRDAGYAGLNSACLGIYGKGQLVSHNTVHSGGRSVIGFGASRSRVAFNDVSRAGLLTWDVGLFTTGNTDGGNSEICFNWFHNNLSSGLARGIYLSTGAHNFLIHHNVAWNCWEGGFHGEPPLEYVQLLNNTFYTTPGSFDAGGVDVSSFTYVDDQIGGVVANNVFTDDIRTLGHDVMLA